MSNFERKSFEASDLAVRVVSVDKTNGQRIKQSPPGRRKADDDRFDKHSTRNGYSSETSSSGAPPSLPPVKVTPPRIKNGRASRKEPPVSPRRKYHHYDKYARHDDGDSSKSEKTSSSGSVIVIPPLPCPKNTLQRNNATKRGMDLTNDDPTVSDILSDLGESLISQETLSSAGPTKVTPKRRNGKGRKRKPQRRQDISRRSSSRRNNEQTDDSLSDYSSDDGQSSRSQDETSRSESSYTYDDESTYVDDKDEGEVLVDMIKQVFTGNNEDDDSLNESTTTSTDDDYSTASSTNKSYEQLCYRVGLNDAKLKEMKIQCDSIGKKDAKQMAEVLPTNTHLKRLCLVFSSDERHAQIFRILLSGLAENENITELEIRGPPNVEMSQEGGSVASPEWNRVGLGRELASWVGTTLALNRSLQKLCLKQCRFVDAGLALLFLGLQHSKIQYLSIKSCNLADSNIDIISGSLPLMEFKSLSLIDTSLTEDGLSFLCENIRKANSITRLDLSRNKLTRQGLAMLTESFKSSEQEVLTELVLASCSLDEACVKELVKGLKQNSSLSVVDLSDNEFGDQGASYLRELLEKNTGIKEIHVEGCNITSRKKLRAIADRLRYNNSFLKSFGFSATTSSAIFNSVDTIEEVGGMIGNAIQGGR